MRDVVKHKHAQLNHIRASIVRTRNRIDALYSYTSIRGNGGNDLELEFERGILAALKKQLREAEAMSAHD